MRWTGTIDLTAHTSSDRFALQLASSARGAILYTSGTTGAPRGIAAMYECIAVRASWDTLS